MTYTSDPLLSFDTDLDLDEGPDEGPSSAADWMDFVERDQLDDASLDDRRRMLVEDLEEPPISNLCCAAALDDLKKPVIHRMSDGYRVKTARVKRGSDA